MDRRPDPYGSVEGLNLKNPVHAYFYGLCIADGYLIEMERGRGRVCVELSMGDNGVLLTLRDLLPWKSTITHRKRTTNFATEHASSSLLFFGAGIREEMKAAGFPTKGKSRAATPPIVPFSAPDFWRGVIDGDGSLGITAKGLAFVSFVTKSDALADAYCDYVAAVTGRRPRVNPNKRDGVRNIVLTNARAADLLDETYEDHWPRIHRKGVMAKKICWNSFPLKNGLTAEDILEVEDG
ncbi:hypothetical protein [Hyphomicrobium sp.]|uniref:hypothetical protein n=1 Tax=Hyphomicrobium sp. TaxID=82 RepID=UPI001D713B65|nr:hypothetical protein [Hyphomicrobium sp.]MBY0559906.1 hypothetical protein [Hyphomicrobium sp.]